MLARIVLALAFVVGLAAPARAAAWPQPAQGTYVVSCLPIPRADGSDG